MNRISVDNNALGLKKKYVKPEEYMARQIVTQALVDEIADAMILEGAEPSIVAVQSRIGGGSFSTVKRFLDTWRRARAELANAAPETPPEIQAKANEFTRTLWTFATREANRLWQSERDEAMATIALIRSDFAEATTEIGRLEAAEAALVTTSERQTLQVRELELELVQAKAEARRVEELEQSLAAVRVELDDSRREATAGAVELGRLGGEAEALRAQVRDLINAIKA